jgi:hypothetical protein
VWGRMDQTERVALARASNGMNPYTSNYCDVDGCIENLERLVCEELVES